MMDVGTVKGKVRDKKGQAQVGAEVQVEETQLVGVTDLEGTYCIEKVPAGIHRIQCSMVIGQETKEVKVPVGGIVVVDFTVNPL